MRRVTIGDCRTYRDCVSFNERDHHQRTDTSNQKCYNRNFKYTNYTPQEGPRTYICGVDESDYAAAALEYLIEELVDDGDHVVCVRIVDRHINYKRKARLLKRQALAMLDKNKGPGIKVYIEIIWGEVRKELLDIVNRYPPIAIVVGTQGKSLFGSNFGKNSVSHHLYRYSPAPVIIVRPKATRLEKLSRRGRKSRQKYPELLEKDSEQSEKAIGTPLKDPEAEGAAVAQEIGVFADKSLFNLAKRSPDNAASSSREEPVVQEDESPEATDEEEAGCEEGTPLSRMPSKAAMPYLREGVDADVIDEEEEEEDVFETDQFKDQFKQMPNYAPGLEDILEATTSDERSAITNEGECQDKRKEKEHEEE